MTNSLILSNDDTTPLKETLETSHIITLEDAYNIALNNSKDIQTDQVSLGIQRSNHKLGIRDFFPKVSFSAGNNVTINQNATDTYNRTVSGTLTQPVFQGGKIIYQRKISKANIQIGELKLKEKTYNLLKQVWEQYFTILQTEQEIKIREKTFNILNEQLHIVEYQRNQGSITEISYLETVVQIKNEEIALRKLHQELYTQKNTFAQLINIPSYDIRPFQLEIFEIEYQKLNIDEKYIPTLTALAKDNSISLKEKYIQFDQAVNQLDAYRLQFIPTISLQLTGGVSGETFPLTSYNYSSGITFQFSNWGSPISSSETLSSTGDSNISTAESLSVSPINDITQLNNGKSIKLSKQKARIEIDKLLKSIDDKTPQQVSSILFQQEEYLLNQEVLELEKNKREIYLKQNEQGKLTSIKLVEFLTEFQKKEVSLLQAKFALQKNIKDFEFFLGLYEESIYDLL